MSSTVAVSVVKLFEFWTEEDFGKEYYVNILKLKTRIGLEINLYNEVYHGGPCFEFVLGLGQVASVLIGIPNWSLRVRLFSRRY